MKKFLFIYALSLLNLSMKGFSTDLDTLTPFSLSKQSQCEELINELLKPHVTLNSPIWMEVLRELQSLPHEEIISTAQSLQSVYTSPNTSQALEKTYLLKSEWELKIDYLLNHFKWEISWCDEPHEQQIPQTFSEVISPSSIDPLTFLNQASTLLDFDEQTLSLLDFCHPAFDLSFKHKTLALQFPKDFYPLRFIYFFIIHPLLRPNTDFEEDPLFFRLLETLRKAALISLA